MTVLYKPYQSSVVSKSGKKLFYPRVVRTGNVGTSTIAEEIAEYSSLSRGDVKNTIDNLITVLTRHLQSSQTVTLDANVNNAKHKRVLDIRQVEYVSLVENAINFYYLSQNITARFNPQLGGGLWIWPHSGESGKVNWEEALQYDADKTISLQEVVDHQRKSQLTLIGIHYPTTIYTEDYGYELAGTAHSILIYGPPTEAGNYYVFKTYDPNVLSAAKLRISKDYTSCILESTDSSNRVHTTIVEALDYFKNYYYFNCLDLAFLSV